MGTGIIVVSVFFIFLFLLGKFLIFIGESSEKNNLNKIIDSACEKFDIREKHRIVFQSGNGILFGHDGWILYFADGYEKEGSVKYENINGYYIDYEVILGENIVSRKNIINTAGKAVVGGALLGGIGVVAGALLGSSRNERVFNKVGIRLNIAFDNQRIITRDIIMDTGKAVVKEDSALYEHAMKELDFMIQEIENNNFGLED